MYLKFDLKYSVYISSISVSNLTKGDATCDAPWGKRDGYNFWEASEARTLKFGTCHASVDVTGEFLNLAYPRPILSKFYSILTLLTYCELKLVPLQSGYDVTHLSLR